MPALADAVLPRWFTADLSQREPVVLAMIRDVFVHTDKEGYASNCDAIDATDLRPEAPGIKVPALVISGTHDLAATPAQGRELAQSIRRRALRRTGRLAHFQHRESRRFHEDRDRFPDGAEMNDEDRYEAGLDVRRAVLGSAHVDRSLANRTESDGQSSRISSRAMRGAKSGRVTACRATRAAC